MTIQINPKDFSIRCVGGYGPQENDSLERKVKFWSRLDAEVQEADNLDVGFILQMDGNLWAGPELIPGDPNLANINGRLFKEFLSRNPDLIIVNSLSICQGLITRQRQTVKKLEKSVLDFFVVCRRVLQFIKKMTIDENRDFGLTNFNNKRGKSCPVESDHNPIILDLNISYSKPLKQRIEIYNLKHLESQQVFKEITSKSTMLSKCFTNGDNLKQQVESWEKNLTFAISQSFKRIRITDSIKTSESDKLMEKRKNLKNELKTVSDIQTVQMVQNEICSVEEQLSNLLADENVKKIKDNLSMLTETDGSINVSGVWKIKKKIFPKNMKTLPIAKKDVNGRLVSNPEELKTLYIQTYIHRVRHRPVKPGFEELKMLKEELCARRLELVKMKTFQPWCSKDLVKVLQSLKNNKARDPHSLINEIFKPGVIGLDLQNSLLLMFNRIKEKFEIPEILQFANIISIYKGKNEKTSLENDRGILI